MESFMVRAGGIAPILMHNPQTVDAFNPYSRAMKEITSLPPRDKTDDLLKELMWLEYQSAIYWEDGIGAVIPVVMMEACIRQGATFQRLGTTVKRAVMVSPEVENLALEYKPKKKTVEALYADAQFVDKRYVGVGRNKVIRTRPRFNVWELTFEVQFDADQIDRDCLIKAIKDGGKYRAIGDYRPRFGRFEILEIV
jgi:hypothetical protein